MGLFVCAMGWNRVCTLTVKWGGSFFFLSFGLLFPNQSVKAFFRVINQWQRRGRKDAKTYGGGLSLNKGEGRKTGPCRVFFFNDDTGPTRIDINTLGTAVCDSVYLYNASFFVFYLCCEILSIETAQKISSPIIYLTIVVDRRNLKGLRDSARNGREKKMELLHYSFWLDYVVDEILLLK